MLLFAGRASREALPQPEGMYEALESFNHREFSLRPPAGSRHRSLGLLRFIVLTGLAYVGLGLALDARYRGFPTCFYLLPVLALLLLALLGRGSRRLPLRGMPEETLLAGLAGACAVVSVLREGVMNGPALGFAGLCLVCAGVLLWPGDRRTGQHE
jgi:hypothetical protein